MRLRGFHDFRKFVVVVGMKIAILSNFVLSSETLALSFLLIMINVNLTAVCAGEFGTTLCTFAKGIKVMGAGVVGMDKNRSSRS